MTHRGYLKAHMARIKPEVYGDLTCEQNEVSIKMNVIVGLNVKRGFVCYPLD